MDENNKIQTLNVGAAKPIKVTGAQANQIVVQQNLYQQQLEAMKKKEDIVVSDVNTTGYVKPTELKKYDFVDDVQTHQVDNVNSLASSNQNDKKTIIIMCIIVAVILLIFLIFELPMILNS